MPVPSATAALSPPSTTPPVQAAYVLLEKSFGGPPESAAPSNQDQSKIGRQRNVTGLESSSTTGSRRFSIEPPLRKITDPPSDDAGEDDDKKLGSPFLMPAQDSGLPPTPPSNENLAGDQPPFTESATTSRMAKSSSTPVNQRSPPTPDVTPPRNTSESLLPPPTVRYPSSSRAESFTTAPESHSTDDGSSIHTSALEDRGESPLPGVEYLDATRPARLRELGFDITSEGDDRSATPKPTAPPAKRHTAGSNGSFAFDPTRTSAIMDRIPNREWDTNLMRNVTVRRAGNPRSKKQPRLSSDEEDDDIMPTSYGTRELVLRDRLPRSASLRISSAPRPTSSGTTSSGLANPDSNIPFGQRDQRRSSSQSASSAVVEAIVVETPRRDRTLRHSGKDLNLRSKISTNLDVSPKSHVNRIHRATQLSDDIMRGISPLSDRRKTSSNFSYDPSGSQEGSSIKRRETVAGHPSPKHRIVSDPLSRSSRPQQRSHLSREIGGDDIAPISPVKSNGRSEANKVPIATRAETSGDAKKSRRKKEDLSVYDGPYSKAPATKLNHPALPQPNNNVPTRSVSDPLRHHARSENLRLTRRQESDDRREYMRKISRSSNIPAIVEPENDRTATQLARPVLEHRRVMDIHERPHRRRASLDPNQIEDSHRYSADTVHTDESHTRRMSFDRSTVRTDEHATARHTFGAITPFSQMSELEVNEATAVNIYPHNNRSLLQVEVQQMNRPVTELIKHEEVILDEGEPAREGYFEPTKITLQPSTPPISGPDASHLVESPLKNPRKPPEPPAFRVIPPTPISELDRQLAASRASEQPPTDFPPVSRGRSLRQRARRYSDSIITPLRLRAPSLSRRLRARNPATTQHPKKAVRPIPSVSEQESDNRLHPFWRPRGFWDSDSESDFFYDDDEDMGDDRLPPGGDTSDVGSDGSYEDLTDSEPWSRRRVKFPSATLGRRMTRRMSGFRGSGGFLVGNSLGVERAGTNRRRHYVSLPGTLLARLQKSNTGARIQKRASTGSLRRAALNAPAVRYDEEAIVVERVGVRATRQPDPTSDASVQANASTGAGASSYTDASSAIGSNTNDAGNKEDETGRRRDRPYRVPGTEFRVQYVGLRGVAERMRERRAEKRRERIRKSIGSRFLVEGARVA